MPLKRSMKISENMLLEACRVTNVYPKIEFVYPRKLTINTGRIGVFVVVKA